MPLSDIRNPVERQIAEKIINDVLAAGAAISVNDGEVTTLARSRDKAAILAAMGTTDEDVIYIFPADGGPSGWVRLIYGNGADLISDAYNADCFLAGADALAEALSEASPTGRSQQERA